MDRRTLLEKGACLNFPGMPCTIESLAGKGADAIVYLGSYPDEQQPHLRHRVLIKELFPYHPQGAVYRDEEDNICFDEDGEETMRLHRMSFGRGNEVHIRLQGSHPEELDFHVNTFSMHHTLYSVLGFSGGRSMDRESALPGAGKTPLTVHIRRMMGVLNVLEAFHEEGYLHLDISPDNILLLGEGRKERVSLIDYNSVHTLEEIQNRKSVYYSAKEGYTAPEIQMGRIRSIGFSADLYSVTAVFYRCITGRKLTAMQMISRAVPALSDAECVKGMPDTVLGMLQRIMKRGLAPSIRLRYPDVPAMRKDLEELQDRIEGKGITHWALWEVGRASILRTVKANPALDYIREEEKLYPIAGAHSDGKRVTLPELFQSVIMSEGCPAVLLGSGGMGKTTALLRMAYLQPPQYCDVKPAVFYISLYGWNNSGDDYIKNKILENLRFKQETDSMEMAKHELLRLLSAPFYTLPDAKRPFVRSTLDAGCPNGYTLPDAKRPKLLLLLDGYNEASGELTLLLKEISELSALAGLRILLTSRSPISGLDCQEIRLCQMDEAEVVGILAKNGILPPENKKLLRLLCTPMMLSIFVKTALDGGKQLLIDSKEADPQKQLLSRYLSAMLEKEEKNAPEDPQRKWGTEAALYYVLPKLADFLKSKGTAASDQELLPLINKCFHRLSKSDMTAVFPEWIGRLSDIRGNAGNAEEWYGLMVHSILWRRLGLLIRDEDGKYRIVHQLIEGYLAEICRDFERKFAWRQRSRNAVIALVCLLLAGASWKWLYLPYQASLVQEEKKVHYDEALSDTVLSTAFQAYINLARQYESVVDILECLQEEETDEKEYERALLGFDTVISTTSADHTERMSGYADTLLTTGEVMPWSEEPLDAEAYKKLVSLPTERAENYLKYIEILKELKNDRTIWEEFGEDYLEELALAVECDAHVAGKYYKILIEPELDAMEENGSQEEKKQRHQFAKTQADYPKQNEVTKMCDEDSLEQYEENQDTAWEVLYRNTAVYMTARGSQGENTEK